MLASAIFVLVVGVQLLLSVEGNCTTEFSEDELYETSSLSNDDQNASQDGIQSSTQNATAIPIDGGATKTVDTVETLPEHDYLRGEKNRFNRDIYNQSMITGAGSVNMTEGPTSSLPSTSDTKNLSHDGDWTVRQDAGEPVIPEKVSDYDYLELDKKRFNRDTDDQGTIASAGSATVSGGPAVSPSLSTQMNTSASVSDGIKNESQDGDSAVGRDAGEPEIPDKAPEYDYIETDKKRFNRDTNDQGMIASAGVSGRPTDSTGLSTQISTTASTRDGIKNPSQDRDSAIGQDAGEHEIPDKASENDYIKADKNRLNRDTNDQGIIASADSATVSGGPAVSPSLSTQMSTSVSVSDGVRNPSQESDWAVGQDSGEPEIPDKAPEYDYIGTDKKRFNRDTDDQGMIASTGVSGRPTVSPGSSTQISTLASASDDIRKTSQQGSESAVERDTGKPAIPSTIVPISEMIYNRVNRDTIDQKLVSRSSSIVMVAETVTAGLSMDIQTSTPTGKKLKRFPSLQYIARKAILDVNKKTSDQIKRSDPIAQVFRYKRDLIASYNDLPIAPSKNRLKRLISLHFF